MYILLKQRHVDCISYGFNRPKMVIEPVITKTNAIKGTVHRVFFKLSTVLNDNSKKYFCISVLARQNTILDSASTGVSANAQCQ